MKKGDVFTPCARGNFQGFKRAFIILGLVLVSGILSARANLYYDSDYINTVLSSINPEKNGTFNVAFQGYRPSAEISLGHEAVNYEHSEYGFNIFGGLLAGDALLDLGADGIISYNVRWASGGPFKLVSDTLLAETTANSLGVHVPAGGLTLAMLGLALLGLGWTQRRLNPSRND